MDKLFELINLVKDTPLSLELHNFDDGTWSIGVYCENRNTAAGMEVLYNEWSGNLDELALEAFYAAQNWIGSKKFHSKFCGMDCILDMTWGTDVGLQAERLPDNILSIRTFYKDIATGATEEITQYQSGDWESVCKMTKDDLSEWFRERFNE